MDSPSIMIDVRLYVSSGWTVCVRFHSPTLRLRSSRTALRRACVSSRNCEHCVAFVRTCRRCCKPGTEDMHSALRCAVSFYAAKQRCCKVASCQPDHRIQTKTEADLLYPKSFGPWRSDRIFLEQALMVIWGRPR